ncbi:hypothetical protein Scep_027397 [Stephania cephalantha]|uniref:MCM9 N-terminal domain-containing protein n=1 Tax=Stephania cephalantha TaxID=152367 RepID=A0AAP0E7V0_9MAGN
MENPKPKLSITTSMASDRSRAFSEFLIGHHSSHMRSILLSEDPLLHYPLHIDFAEVTEDDQKLAHLLFSNPAEFLPIFNDTCRLSQRRSRGLGA